MSCCHKCWINSIFLLGGMVKAMSMKGHLWVYDNDHHRIGWQRSNCKLDQVFGVIGASISASEEKVQTWRLCLKPNHQLQLLGGKNDIYQLVKEIKTTTIVNKNNDPQGGLEINEVPI